MNKAIHDKTIDQVESSDSSDKQLQKMNDSLLIRIVSFSLCFLLIFCPASLRAGEIDPSLKESEVHIEIVEAPSQMTQKQMNDLFGEDPYLGQTSYLQSPDGFSQREK